MNSFKRNNIQFGFEPEPQPSDVVQDVLTHPRSEQQPETD